MNARLDYNSSEVLQKFVRHINAAGRAAGEQSKVPLSTLNLVLIRASQINGCAVCVDMHTKDAAHAGETSVRINLVAAWHDAKVFTDAERAALELAEQGTRIADGAAVSATRPGRTRPSTTTPTNSPRWCARLRSSTPTTG